MAGAGKHRLLTPDEEQELGKRVKHGSPAERDAAINELVICNQKYVYTLARKLSYLARWLSLADLVQEGNLGLHRAAEKFDYERGFRFSTYASNWIMQAIQRGIESQDRVIRVPSYLHTIYHRLRSMRKDLGRDPTPDEAMQAGIRQSALDEIDRWMRTSVSLDEPLGNDSEDSHMSLLPDDGDPVDATFDSGALIQVVRQALEGLPEREQTVLSLRFGIGDDDPQSLEQIGQAIGVTRERVRQIQNRALGRLLEQHPELQMLIV